MIEKMINAKPILFTGEMVRAILDGRKTQTRRILKSAFPKQWPEPVRLADDEGNTGALNDPKYWGYPCAEDGCDMSLADWAYVLCPHGKIGDYLWVRENFAVYGDDDKYVLHFQADVQRGSGWKPSIHMPRKYSRLTLQITDIRVQRVQDISEEDAAAEGVEENWLGYLATGSNGFGGQGWTPENGWRNYLDDEDGEPSYSAKESFKSLWDSINAKRGFGWHENPWVWAITFQTILKNIDDLFNEAHQEQMDTAFYGGAA